MSRLSELRKQNNLTQVQLAELVSSSRRTIQNIENHVKVPSVVLAIRIAHVLNTTVEDLFSDYITEKEGVGSKNE